MGSKRRTKELRSREAFETAKRIGSKPLHFDTPNGTILLNPMKHYCYQDRYSNDNYKLVMLNELKRRYDAYQEIHKDDNKEKTE